MAAIDPYSFDVRSCNITASGSSSSLLQTFITPLQVYIVAAPSTHNRCLMPTLSLLPTHDAIASRLQYHYSTACSTSLSVHLIAAPDPILITSISHRLCLDLPPQCSRILFVQSPSQLLNNSDNRKVETFGEAQHCKHMKLPERAGGVRGSG